MRFSFTIVHVPGEALNTADTLSRAPVNGVDDNDKTFQQEVNAYVRTIVKSLPATEEKLGIIREQQSKDPVSRKL